MTLGRTSSNAIKIKTDAAGGGLRVVNCACCGPCTCVFSEGDIVTISALGKSSTVTIGQTPQGPVSCWGDIGEQTENQVFVPFRVRQTYSDGTPGGTCIPDAIIIETEDFFYAYRWTYSIQGCTCKIEYAENTNISDVMINLRYDACISENFPPGCCVCNEQLETETITKSGVLYFPITGYGTYNVTMPFTEFYFPYCAAYTVQLNTPITVVLSKP